MKKILYITDLYYKAKGREYSEEDIYITGVLKDYFDVILCNPRNSEAFEKDVDLIVFRNTGAISEIKDVYVKFVERIKKNNLKVFNEFTGKGDMCGKQYLLDLTKENFPVIPTVDLLSDLDLLPDVQSYVIKPKDGADSIGLEFLSKEELLKRSFTDRNTLIQPEIDFLYEVSFYFINDKLEYAMYAPDKQKRWELKKYEYTDEDAEFARRFIEWNDIRHGIQRVDACRTKDGELLLVEMEDLNPYLSVLELDEKTRVSFISDMIQALNEMIK